MSARFPWSQRIVRGHRPRLQDNMTKLDRITSRVTCFTAKNVDTDQIIPARFLKRIDKTGFGDHLFADLKPAEVIQIPDARQRQILIAGSNFGCGSSREHAVWAIRDFGRRSGYGYRCLTTARFPTSRGRIGHCSDAAP